MLLKVFMFLLSKELLYMLQDVCFYFTKKEILLLLLVQLHKSPGILSKILEKSWNFDAKSPEKCEKSPRKSWNLNQFFRWEQCLSKSLLM